MTKEKKQEFTLRITQANPTEMVVVLYEMTLCYLEEAKNAMETGEWAAYKVMANKTKACLLELTHSLHLEYEIAANLMQLYQYCLDQLSDAGIYNTAEPLEEVYNVLTKLHEAYIQVAKQDNRSTVMQNSQTVYAGLTYGKTNLTENMADQGGNRGFLI
ncbi:flagellar protein FliS [Lachnospiraceae bacterium OttesenSCG-928-D06]|nr:flagellar protein FliS [Lachnospiraceae bacterium OttesenSCG-928-D06]